MNKVISEWQTKLGITGWNITTERIDPEQVMYDGEEYFIGISIDWDRLKGIIYHDIDLKEDSIVHELLHIKYSTKNEEWINNKTEKLIKQNKDQKKINKNFEINKYGEDDFATPQNGK